MNYTEFDIPPFLKPFISCIWADRTSYHGANRQKLWFPNGAVELIFNLGTPYKRNSPGDHAFNLSVSKPVLIGQMKKLVFLELTENNYVIGIRFTPVGFSSFSIMPLNEITGQLISIQYVLTNKAEFIEEQVKEANSIEKKISLLLDYLYQNWNPKKSNALVRAAVDHIVKRNGEIKIKELIHILNTSDKTLETKFKIYLGLNPKEFIKICRLNHFLLNYHKNSRSTFTTLSNDSNFYDQSHLIKEIKSFSSVGPKELLRDGSGLFDININSLICS